MKKVLLASLIAFIASQGSAADGDMRVGTFGIVFCGAPATFEVQMQHRGTWVFQGRIHIRDTGENDALKIIQYADNSLRIIRGLSGANIGQNQTVETDPPRFEGGLAVFRSLGGRGVGCNNPGAYTQLEIPL